MARSSERNVAKKLESAISLFVVREGQSHARRSRAHRFIRSSRSLLLGGDVELEEDDVVIVDDGVFPSCRYFAFTSPSLPSSFSTSNAITSAQMNPRSKSVWMAPAAGRLESLADAPRFDPPPGEEVDEVDGGEHRLGILGSTVFTSWSFWNCAFVVRGILQFGLEGAGEGDDGPAAVRLNPLESSPATCSSWLKILLGQVDEVDDRLGRQQLVRVDEVHV